MELPRELTIGEKCGPAMQITDQAEADAYFEACVEHCMGFGRSRSEAENIERQNLGYYAGYYDHPTQERVNRLFRTTHPIFGDKHPTPEEAFKVGMEFGRGK
jgi:hypothetical protein